MRQERYAEFSDTVRIRLDTTLVVRLHLISAIIRFRGTNADGPVTGAIVDLEGSETSTNSLGVALFSDIAVEATVDYEVRHSGYTPAHTRLQLETIFEVRELSLTDLNGRPRELSWSAQGLRAVADLTALSPGIYILRLADGQGRTAHVRILVE